MKCDGIIVSGRMEVLLKIILSVVWLNFWVGVGNLYGI